MSQPFSPNLKKYHKSQIKRDRELKFWYNVHPLQHVKYQMSSVMCHMSYVTCHMSCVTCHNYIYIYFFWTKWSRIFVEGLLSTGPTLGVGKFLNHEDIVTGMKITASFTVRRKKCLYVYRSSRCGKMSTLITLGGKLFTKHVWLVFLQGVKFWHIKPSPFTLRRKFLNYLLGLQFVQTRSLATA